MTSNDTSNGNGTLPKGPELQEPLSNGTNELTEPLKAAISNLSSAISSDTTKPTPPQVSRLDGKTYPRLSISPEDFEKGYSIDVEAFIEKKLGADYLKWSYAIRLLKRYFPDLHVGFEDDEINKGDPFEHQDGSSFFIRVYLTDGYARTSSLYYPVLASNNKPIFGKVTSFEYNTNRMRAAVKCISYYTGIGLMLFTREHEIQGSDLDKNLNQGREDKVLREAYIEKIKKGLAACAKMAPLTQELQLTVALESLDTKALELFLQKVVARHKLLTTREEEKKNTQKEDQKRTTDGSDNGLVASPAPAPEPPTPASSSDAPVASAPPPGLEDPNSGPEPFPH